MEAIGAYGQGLIDLEDENARTRRERTRRERSLDENVQELHRAECHGLPGSWTTQMFGL